MSARRDFERSIGALGALLEFTAEAFAAEGVDDELRKDVDFVLEELFTNVVKYGRPSETPVRVEISGVPGGVEVALTENDAERFDPTRAPAVDVQAPIEDRRPGGLGLYLVGKLVDAIEYRYFEETRQGRITFRRTLAHAALEGGGNARD